MKKKRFVVVFVMCASRREACAIVDALLRKRLIACANIIGGVDSRFWWKGKIESARETLVIMKTTGSGFAGVERQVRRIHSYDVPEIIAMPIAAGSERYLRWIGESVKTGMEERA